MSIPDFQSVMLPFLRLLDGAHERTMKEMVQLLSDEFSLSEEERTELLPSGQQPVFGNRVAWARTHLKKAGLIDVPSRGRVRLSPRGSEILRQSPERINARFLRQFDSYLEFVRGTSGPNDAVTTPNEQPSDAHEQTPVESIESSIKDLNSALADELLAKLGEATPAFFEKVVVQLLEAMGYGGGLGTSEVTSYGRDGGIDGLIREDKLGLDVVCVQAKRWQGTVGRPVVQGFVGSMDLVRAKKGVILTTGKFSGDATDFIDRIEGKRVVLIDGSRLAKLMIEHDVGVITRTIYKLKEVSGDFFEEGLDG